MSEIPLYYGSSTGNTEASAELIAEEFSNQHDILIKLINVCDIDAEQLIEVDKMIIGVPTWESGELQQDWEYLFDELDDLDFSNKKIALFGQGDASGYPDTYQDAIGILAKKLRDLGAEITGKTSIDGYDFTDSVAVEGEHFLGLALDNDNEEELTEPRIQSWVTQLAGEF